MVETEKFKQWLGLVRKIHPGFEFEAHREVPWVALRRPLKECKIALVTTAGVHGIQQSQFDEESVTGDFSLREISSGMASSELKITHGHYDHRDGDQDINCVFPIDRLRELSREGVVGPLADTFFGMCGFTPHPRRFLEKTTPRIVESLQSEQVEVALLTPG